ncbi:MAG: AbrB/MazE/SpoVT family DNA-binding domain-containing protein [Methanobacteriota archaeon]
MTLVKISNKGQIVIPVTIRKKWQIQGGETVILTDDAQGIHIRPLVRLSDLSGIDEGKGLLQKLLEMREEERTL